MNLIVLAMALMVLLYQIEDVINVDLHLLYQFHLKLYVVVYVRLVACVVSAVVVVQVYVYAGVVLYLSCGQWVALGKLVKATQ